MSFSDSTAARLTARTIADSDIIALRDDAGRAGDFEQVHICNRALSRRGGRGACAEAINGARAA